MSIDLSKFKLFEPPPKPSQFAINVTASGRVNLSNMLNKKLLSTAVGLWIHNDGTQIILDLQAKNPFKILKRGSINALEFTRELASKGIELPARFDANFHEEQQMWLGTLIKPKKPRKSIHSNKNKLNKPRTTGLKDMM